MVQLTATISYPYDQRIEQLFAAEEKRFPKTQYSLAKQGDALVFSIVAEDATALRAAPRFTNTRPGFAAFAARAQAGRAPSRRPPPACRRSRTPCGSGRRPRVGGPPDRKSVV